MNTSEGPTPEADGDETVIELLGADYVAPEGPIGSADR